MRGWLPGLARSRRAGAGYQPACRRCQCFGCLPTVPAVPIRCLPSPGCRQTCAAWCSAMTARRTARCSATKLREPVADGVSPCAWRATGAWPWCSARDCICRAGTSPLHRRLRKGALVTASAHDLLEGIEAWNAGASMVFLSPVFPTASHPGARGLGALRWQRIAQGIGIPVLALGGVDGSSAFRLPVSCAGAGAIAALSRDPAPTAPQAASWRNRCRGLEQPQPAAAPWPGYSGKHAASHRPHSFQPSSDRALPGAHCRDRGGARNAACRLWRRRQGRREADVRHTIQRLPLPGWHARNPTRTRRRTPSRKPARRCR